VPSVPLPGRRVTGWLGMAGVVSVVIYGVIMGYWNDPALLVTVVIVRLAAAFGLAAVIGILVAIAMLLCRQDRVVSGFARITVCVGSLVTLGLVVTNLLR
jgi:hypothetical protein